MENPTTWLVIVVLGGFYLIARVLDKALKELTTIRQQVSQIDLKPIFNELANQGSRIGDLAYETYLLRRIAEEKTGISKEDVSVMDKKDMDDSLKNLEEVIKRRDSAKDGE